MFRGPFQRGGPSRGYSVVLLAALLPLLVLAPSLLFPYWRDQAVFAYVGEVIARGGMPYRDAWDLKPPGIYLAYAAVAAAVPGGPEALRSALRVTDLLIAAGVGVLLLLLARRWTRNPGAAGAAAAAWCAALYFQGGYGAVGQAEAWANLPALGCALLCLREADAKKPCPGMLLLAGLLAGLVAALKFTALLPLLPFLFLAVASPGVRASLISLADKRGCRQDPLAPFAYADVRMDALSPVLDGGGIDASSPGSGRESGRRARRLSTTSPAGILLRAAALAAGAVLPVLAVALWLRAGGAWDDYLQIQHGFVAPYVRLNTPDAGARLAAVAVGTWTWLQVTAVPILLAPLAFLRNPHDPGLRTRDSGLRAAAAAALALGVLSVWVQGKFFRYHWQPVLPWLSLLAAAGSLELAARLRLPRPILPAAAFGAALLWTACAGWGWYRDAALLAAGAIPEDRWLAHFESAGSVSSARTNRRLAAYVRGHTGSEDPILVWGFEPQVYHFSRRECPTRFFFNVPVAVEFTPSQWRQEMLADLDRSPPALILVARNDAIPWANGRRDDSLAQLRAWPDLWGRVERDYGLETEIGHFLVYRRRAEGGSPGK